MPPRYFDAVQLCLALPRAHNVRGERGEHASRRQKCRYLIDGMVQLAHHERLREQIACQGAGEDAEVLAHHCYRVAFFVVGLPHLAIGVLYIERAPAVVAYAKRCRATACGTHGLRCKCRCASRPSNMLQLLVDGSQKARVLRHGTAWGTVASGDITPQLAMDWPITRTMHSHNRLRSRMQWAPPFCR